MNPVTGARELVLMSPAQEEVLGRQEAAKVEQQIGLVEDLELEAYVRAIGDRLARHSPRRDVSYRFAVAHMEEPNAFALPAGYVYVSRGLLAIANSEDELANVIGHEIGHVAARHAAQRQTRAAGAGLATLGAVLIGAVLGGDVGAQLGGQLAQVAGAGLIASYSRDQERQADEVGQQIAAAAGYDPAGMSRFLSTLERDARLQQGGRARRPSFLDSHPMTAERVQTTLARARTLSSAPPAPVASGRAGFLARLEGLLLGPNPAEGVFDGRRFLHPDLAFALDFPAGWKTVNGRQMVAAQSPDADAALVLVAQGPAGDPRVAAERFAAENRLLLQDGQGGRVGGFDAYRARARVEAADGALALDLFWISHPRVVFRLTGMTSPGHRSARAADFAETARSFRSLSRPEREGFHELRLALVTARRAETLAALSARSGNRWTLDQTAVANALERAEILAGGQLVKVAHQRPYLPDSPR